MMNWWIVIATFLLLNCVSDTLRAVCIMVKARLEIEDALIWFLDPDFLRVFGSTIYQVVMNTIAGIFLLCYIIGTGGVR